MEEKEWVGKGKGEETKKGEERGNDSPYRLKSSV